MQNKLELTGKTFGHLTVICSDLSEKKWKHKYSWWICKCSCGKEVSVAGSRLVSGERKSCGCLSGNVKHGLGRSGKLTTNYKMWRSAKIRAKRSNMLFTITPEDIVIPEKCPLLNILISTSNNNTQDNSPSLDRVDNSKGYSPENIWVVSHKANRTKSNLSLSELKMLVENFEQKIVEQKIHETRKS